VLLSAWMLVDGLWHRRVRLQGGPVWWHQRPAMFWLLIAVNCGILLGWSLALWMLW
jgi:hypothetical protein